MKITISALSDKGCVREHNEDMVLVGYDIFRNGSKRLDVDLNGESSKFLIAVADGMGGHNAGEVASEIVLQRMTEKIRALEPGLTEKELSDRILEWTKEIHRHILNEGNDDIEKKGMGSTFIGVLLYDDSVYYINVGDSRLYRFRRGNLMQISKDHSLREIMNNNNAPSNIIVNSFGGGDKLFFDFSPVGGRVLNGDALLLCSDGLSDMLDDDEIENILSREAPVENLLAEAKRKGGEDNISVVLVHLQL